MNKAGGHSIFQIEPLFYFRKEKNPPLFQILTIDEPMRLKFKKDHSIAINLYQYHLKEFMYKKLLFFFLTLILHEKNALLYFHCLLFAEF